MLTEKLDLRRLAKLAGVHRKEGTPFVSVTPDEIDSLIARIRSLESRASNAGGAVAFDPWFNEQIKSGNLLSYEDAKAGWDGFAETQTTVTGGTVNLDLTGLSIHPAPASKEPVADERAALYQAIHDALMEHDLSYTEDTGSGEKFPLVDKLCAPGDKTIQTGKDEIAILTETILDAIPPARAALATAQADQWVPVVHGDIPDKGTPVIAWHEDFGAITIDAEYLAPSFPEYTHWMPLPAAPAKPEGGNV